MIEKAQYFRIKFIFFLATITLVVLSIISYIRIKNLIDEADLVNHTNQVKICLGEITVAAIETEIHQKNYLLSKNPALLLKSDSAFNDLNLNLNLIEGLIKDNPKQIENLKKLTNSINLKKLQMKKALQEYGSNKAKDLNSLEFKTNIKVDAQLTENIKEQINKMQIEENKLFQIRFSSMNKSAAITPLYTILLIIGSIIILFASYFKIINELKKSDILKINIERSKNELEISHQLLIEKNNEKEKRAAELIIANKELAFQNEEKGKRADELIVANIELIYQNEEKEKRAAELIVANKELAFQNEEKEKNAIELINANKELESFTYISSHDLQEPLRQIQNFASRIISDEQQNLSEKGKLYFEKMNNAANRMQTLIADLLAYSRATSAERKFENTDLNLIIEQVKTEFKETIEEKHAVFDIDEMCEANIIVFQFRQLIHNIIGNALKFSRPNVPPHIKITSRVVRYSKANAANLTPNKEYCHISIADNGIGFEPQYKDRIFEVFQRLHDKQKIPGTGIGLAIVKKIIENHSGIITATGVADMGATFDIYIPTIQTA